MVILIGLIPAMVASKKGHSFPLWWIYGSLLFIIALPHALLIKPAIETIERQQAAQGLKKCPFCAEMIKPDARVCRYCGRDLPAHTPQQAAAPAQSTPTHPAVVREDTAWDDPSGGADERKRRDLLKARLDEFRKQQQPGR